jgi:hypothetical protein
VAKPGISWGKSWLLKVARRPKPEELLAAE